MKTTPLLASVFASALFAVQAAPDWLLDPTPYVADIHEEAGAVVLENGLVRREILTSPGAATFSLKNLVSGAEYVRSVAPEAYVSLDGVNYPVGGLENVPFGNFLMRAWIKDMEPVLGSYRLKSWTVTNIPERLAWKRRPEWVAEEHPWPPKGKRLVMTFVPPASVSDEDLGEPVLFEDMTHAWDPSWREILSSHTDRTSCRNEAKPGEIYSRVGAYAYLEHDWPDEAYYLSAVVSTDIDEDQYCWGPSIALYFRNPEGGEDIRIAVTPRAAKREYEMESNFASQFVGKFDADKPAKLELFKKGDLWIGRMSQKDCEPASFQFPEPYKGAKPYRFAVGKLGYQRRGKMLPAGMDMFHCPNPPGDWIETRILSIAVRKPPVPRSSPLAAVPDLPEVDVNYEIYDGAPIVGKSLTVRNTTTKPVTVTGFAEENLRVVERSYAAQERNYAPFDFYVESNYYMDMMEEGHTDKNRTARYLADPDYLSQVDCTRQNAAILRVGSDVGPDQVILPGNSFESPYSWILLFDSTDRTRRQLALTRFYRILAPWTAENPLVIFHNTDPSVENTRKVLRQCAETGIEICTQSFRCGFDLESTNAAYRAAYEAVGREAERLGVAFGAYALTSCRTADCPENMVKDPNPDYGIAPCLASSWGADFVKNCGDFLTMAHMGFFENDGPYWHGTCSATNHPNHRGYGDSQWQQWQAQAGLYRRCRANGIYVNQPAWYFMEGGSSTGIGYSEQHWNLGHQEQEMVERANIWDGTWNRPLSMSWCCIPFVVYHGGGTRASYEPLRNNVADLDRRFANVHGCGVKVTLRGFEVYDSPEVKAVLEKWRDFRRAHWEVLNGDFIRLRRVNGRDWDGWVMENARAKGEKALAALFNPTASPITCTIDFPLYYAGLADESRTVTIPARGYVFESFR